MNALVDNFKSIYEQLNLETIDRIQEIYTNDVGFVDPFHEVNGLENLINYFSKLYKNLESCQFEFKNVYSRYSSAIITWDMKFCHHSLSKDVIHVPGSSEILFSEKIYYHRDYFDAGKMIYENVPVIGRAVKFIKKQV